MRHIIELDGQTIDFQPGETVLEVARRAGIDIPTLCYDPQVQANGYVAEVDDPELGKMKLVGCPVTFEKTPAAVTALAPQHGEHTEAVLMELCGYSWEELQALRDSGAI